MLNATFKKVDMNHMSLVSDFGTRPAVSREGYVD